MFTAKLIGTDGGVALNVFETWNAAYERVSPKRPESSADEACEAAEIHEDGLGLMWSRSPLRVPDGSTSN
jgi:hypothetical protein